MPKPKKDGRYINCYLDRNSFNRRCMYANDKGQTKTMAIERILKERLDKAGVPAKVDDNDTTTE